jgi:hypothetical protein
MLRRMDNEERCCGAPARQVHSAARPPPVAMAGEDMSARSTRARTSASGAESGA